MSLQLIIETSSFIPEIGLSSESVSVSNSINIPNSSVTVTTLPQILAPTTNNYSKVNSIEFNDIYSSKATNVPSSQAPNSSLTNDNGGVIATTKSSIIQSTTSTTTTTVSINSTATTYPPTSTSTITTTPSTDTTSYTTTSTTSETTTRIISTTTSTTSETTTRTTSTTTSTTIETTAASGRTQTAVRWFARFQKGLKQDTGDRETGLQLETLEEEPRRPHHIYSEPTATTSG